MKVNAALLSFLTAILVSGMLSIYVSAWEPQRGLKIDKLRFKVIKSPDAQLLAMQTDEIDILADPMRTNDLEMLDGDGFTITSTPGLHMGHVLFNIRANQSYREDRPDAYQVGLVLSDVNFRHACFHAYDQEAICASIYGYIVEPIPSLVPPAQGAWFNPAVPRHPYNPGDKLEIAEYPEDHSSCGILRYGGYKYDQTQNNWITPFDLDGDGIPGTNHPDRPLTILDSDDAIPEIRMFAPTYEMAPTSCLHATRWIEDLHEIGLNSMELDLRECWSCIRPLVFAWAYFDIYMDFWTLGQFPDQLYYLCHSSQDCQKYPWRYNAPGINDPLIDQYATTVMTSLVHADKLQACHKAQEWLYDENNPQGLAYMQLYSRVYFSAFKPGLRGIINSPGYGCHNSWMYFNMHWQPGHPDERIEDDETTVVQCLDEGPETLSPLYAGRWAIWATGDVFSAEVQVLDRICDPLIMVNPYDHEDLPWLATDWEAVGPVDVPEKGIVDGMTITFWLNNTVYWHDGNPYTAEDAEFNWLFLRDNEIPMWSWMWEHIVDVEVMSPHTVKVYSDITSQFLVYYLGVSAALLPRPVWEPLDGKPLDEILAYDPSTNRTKPAGAGPNFGTPECLTQLYGTGPFTFQSYNSAGMVAELHANRNYFKTTAEMEALKAEMFHKIGDVDYNGHVWLNDLVRASAAFGCMTSDPCYDADADLNEDSIVDIRDIALIAFFLGDQREYP